MSRLARIIVISLSLAVFSYVSLGYVLGKATDDKAYRSLGVYGEVVERIQQDYVEEPNLQLVTAGALHGLLESLDPLSSYMSAPEYAEYKEKLQTRSNGRIGVAVSKRFGYIIVISVLPDSPAQKAGLRTGDILEAIAGFTTREMSVGQALNLLDGEPGTGVKVSVVRRGRTQTQEVDLVRARLTPLPVTADKLNGDTAYLRVTELNKGKAGEIREKLAQFDRQGLHKLVLDLRGCAWGENSEGIAVARLFLSSGNVVTLRGQTVPADAYAAQPDKVAWKYPISVLTSASTAGSAEIVAAAIASNHRGDVVGERTFGVASEQKLIPLEDGAAIVLTVANYFAPGGDKAIAEEGVAPTTEVSAADNDQTDAATVEAPPTGPPATRDDPILNKALELLKSDPHKVALAPEDQPAGRRAPRVRSTRAA